jgi:hypothetical protein
MSSTSKISTIDLTVVRLLVLNRALGSALGLLLGVSILAGTNLLGVLDIPEDFYSVQTLLGALLYYGFIYMTLVFAKNSGDDQIKSPIGWTLATIVPLFNIYVHFSVLPRVIANWLKGRLAITLSEAVIRFYLVLTVSLNLFVQVVARFTGSLDVLSWSLVVDGALGLLAAWALRSALYPQASK